MSPIPHIFYGEHVLCDLRYLVFAEPWEDQGDPANTIFGVRQDAWGIGLFLDIADTAQRVSLTYPTQEERDRAFQRLLAMHQAFHQTLHRQAAPDEEGGEDETL